MITSKASKRKSCTPILFKEFQDSVLNRVKEDHCVKGTTAHENKRRRAVCVTRKNGVFGFTIQTYGIKREAPADPSELLDIPQCQPTVHLITFIDYVALESPAYYAGLKRGDVILAVNGISMESTGHEELVAYIASQQSIRMVVLFEDCSQKIDLNLRYLKLKEILDAKLKELASVQVQEKALLVVCTTGDIEASLAIRLTSRLKLLEPNQASQLNPTNSVTLGFSKMVRANKKRLSSLMMPRLTRNESLASIHEKKNGGGGGENCLPPRENGSRPSAFPSFFDTLQFKVLAWHDKYSLPQTPTCETSLDLSITSVNFSAQFLRATNDDNTSSKSTSPRVPLTSSPNLAVGKIRSPDPNRYSHPSANTKERPSTRSVKILSLQDLNLSPTSCLEENVETDEPPHTCNVVKAGNLLRKTLSTPSLRPPTNSLGSDTKFRSSWREDGMIEAPAKREISAGELKFFGSLFPPPTLSNGSNTHPHAIQSELTLIPSPNPNRASTPIAEGADKSSQIHHQPTFEILNLSRSPLPNKLSKTHSRSVTPTLNECCSGKFVCGLGRALSSLDVSFIDNILYPETDRGFKFTRL